MQEWTEIRRRVLVEGVSRRQILWETPMRWHTVMRFHEDVRPIDFAADDPFLG
jgi:hypothetical protein